MSDATNSAAEPEGCAKVTIRNYYRRVIFEETVRVNRTPTGWSHAIAFGQPAYVGHGETVTVIPLPEEPESAGKSNLPAKTKSADEKKPTKTKIARKRNPSAKAKGAGEPKLPEQTTTAREMRAAKDLHPGDSIMLNLGGIVVERAIDEVIPNKRKRTVTVFLSLERGRRPRFTVGKDMLVRFVKPGADEGHG